MAGKRCTSLPILLSVCLSFHFTESRNEPTCSRRPRSSTKQYQNLQDHRYNYSWVFRFLSSSSCLRDTGPTGGKPDRLLVWIHRMIRYLLFRCSESVYLLLPNQPISLCSQAVPQRSFRQTDFKEKPKYRKREKKIDAEKNDGQENQRENETRLSEQYHSERRNGLTIASTQALQQSHLCDHEQNGNTDRKSAAKEEQFWLYFRWGSGRFCSKT